MNIHSTKIIFNFMDFQDINLYNLIKFETLFKEPIKIDKKRIEVNANLNEEFNLNGLYDEKIYLIPTNNQFEEKKTIITLNFDLNTVVNINVNEDGDCNMEITVMWDIDYDDKNNIEERVIPDIMYDGEKIEICEKLYERKRWNFINVKSEKFGNNLFSEKTLSYIQNNKDKSFKYDILINKENDNRFLSEKVYNKIEFFSEKEKENLKNKLEPFAKELKQKIKNYNQTKGLNNLDKEKNLLNMFLFNNIKLFNELRESFTLYNKRWNLNKFSEKDFQLFLLFSDIQLFFKENISQVFSKKIKLEYEDLKNKIIQDGSLTLIEKTRIICGFSKFCSSKFFKDDLIPELHIIEKLVENDPYKMAIEKYRKIINELKESSGYFKKILLFDISASQINNEWDLENIEIKNLEFLKQGKFMLSSISNFKDFKEKLNKINDKKNQGEKITKLTFPSFSMLTLKQTKEHLFNLLPKFFFKIGKNYAFNTLSDVGYSITFFNETKILNSEDANDENPLEPKECVLPLMIEIFREIFYIQKVRCSGDSALLIPTEGKNNFLCLNNFRKVSDIAMKYFLADSYDDLCFLKFRNINLFVLTDSKYWTDINFNKMKQFLREKKEEKTYDENINEDLNDFIFYNQRFYYDDEEDENIRCYFKLYNP